MFVIITNLNFLCKSFSNKVSKKAKIKNRSPDPGHYMGNDKNTRKHHTHEGLEVIPFSAGDHKAAINRQDSNDKDVQARNANNKKDQPKKHRLGTVSKKILKGLNMFDGTNLTLISDVDQDMYHLVLVGT